MIQVRPVHILCDMDGTIIDTEGLKCEAWRRAVAEVSGREPDVAAHHGVYARLVGGTGAQIAHALIDHYGLVVSAEDLWQRRERFRREAYEDPAALRGRAITPVIECIRSIRAGLGVLGGGSTVLVTSATKEQMDRVMAILDVGSLFDEMIWGLEKSEENPACYLAALEALGAAPEDCLALEDTLVGYRAARAAGVPCLLLPNAYTQEQRLAG